MQRLLLFALFLLGPLLSFGQLTPGSIAFTGVNGDGNDDLAFVVLDAIPANTTIYFRDSEWTGSSFPVADESRITWNSGASALPAGTVVTFSNINPDPASPIVASAGTATIAGNRGIAAGGDAFFAFTGTDDNTPTAFLAAISTSGTGEFGSLSGTGLAVGSSAVALDGGNAVVAYNGNRTTISRACYPSVINDATNWLRQANSSGDQSNDGTAPDVPFNVTAFTFGSTCPLPTIAFSAANQAVGENAGQVTLTLNITNPNSQSASVQVIVSSGSASNGSDFTLSAPQTVIFPASSATAQTINIPITDDAAPEADEFVVLRLQSPGNAQIGSTSSQLIFIKDNDKAAPTSSDPAFQLQLLTSYRNPTAGSSEIVTYDKASKRLFIANAVGNKIDIVNFANPSAPAPVASIDVSALGGSINSVAARDGIIAAAIESVPKTDNGKIVFFDANGTILKQVTAGALPDAVFFSPDGKYVVTPNEGEPSDDYQTDPEGSVTIVDISGGVANLSQANVTTVSFASLNSLKASLRTSGIRLYGKKGGVTDGSSVAEDLEPEYISFTPDSRFAYVTLQENNAIIVIDLANKTIADNGGQPFIKPLGLKNHNVDANALDPTDQGGNLLLQKLPVFGMYQPDAIASFSANGQTYFVTANEGDAREYDPLEEEVRIGAGAYVLDPTVFPNAAELKNNLLLGRLNATNQTGDTDGDGDFDQIHVFGSRSFTVWDANGNQVWDSGDEFERYTRDNFPTLFNADNGNSVSVKNRSDNKGLEPEGITTAQIGGKTYAFITLERTGGVMVYNVTNPQAPQFVTYTVNRSVPANNATDDRGPEGIVFISATDSPNGKPMVLLANETSNSISVYQVNGVPTMQQPLALIDPLYNCATGEITFRSEGGDGSPVEYMAIGIKPYSTNPNGVIEAEKRNDPNSGTVITLMARQNGIEVSRQFDFAAFCQGNTPQTLQLVEPLYNCQTGQITFRTTGGDGYPIEFMAIGIKGWSTDPNGVIEAEKRNDPSSGTVVTLMARQSGVVVTRDFDFGAFCGGNTTQPLQLIEPDYNCATGAITFKTTGGNGTPIEFMAIGIKPYSIDPNGVIEAEKRNDPNSGTVVTLMARQSGVVVTRDFDFGAFCRQRARVGVTEATENLQLRLLGNPVKEDLVVEVKGAAGKALTLRLTDLSGKVVESRSLDKANATEWAVFDVHRQPTGILLLQVVTPTQTKAVRLVKE